MSEDSSLELEDYNEDEERGNTSLLSSIQQHKPSVKDKLTSIPHYLRSSRVINGLRRYLQYFITRITGATKKEIIYRVCVTLLIISIITISTRKAGTSETMKKLTYNYYSKIYNQKNVDSIKDLNNIDVSQTLLYKPWADTPLTEDIFRQEYESNNLTAYAENLDFDKFKKQYSKTKGKNHKNDDNEKDLTKLNLNTEETYESLIDCGDLAYNITIENSKLKKALTDDLIQMRRDLIAKNDHISKLIKSNKDKDMSEEEIITKYWSKFGGAPLWLEKEQCYVVYSRVFYSPSGHKTASRISLIRAQAFDKNWNELKGKKIPFVDIKVPKNFQSELNKLDKEFGLNQCDHLKNDEKAYNFCILDNVKTKLKAKERREKVLSHYYITYPTVLDIEFDSSGMLSGPEDPHVILRKTANIEEPIIFFNMQDHKANNRPMYAYLPHRKTSPMLKFNLNGRKLNDVEKNWAPFFHQNVKDNSFSRGSIHFIYSFAPLEIMKCSLDDGECKMDFEAVTNGANEGQKFGNMRGATQYVPLPAILPKVKNKQVWVGFPKVHLGFCGCGGGFYRPMLSVLVESNGVYYQSAIVPSMDFNIEVLSWEEEGSNCDSGNILNPNSISFWEVTSQDLETKKFEDYMGIAVSESDVVTKVLTLKGVLNFVLGIYNDKPMNEEFDINEDSRSIIDKTTNCVVTGVLRECDRYGKEHDKNVKEQKKTDESKEKGKESQPKNS
ncbi:uncharacterized protein NDAI_0I02510 [Naumovozyma dairenensis CBS 421]|uniref:Glycosyltransferase family 91 protein n=1 Tax=Naumovozyma dairenensis (strain ATCC 10597 / BCRC 20456 / CBS 421 / NBRC 0211 / NRRL Y-12639) TaxID=1071378 RepID=G0WGA8_NAUDC|nr:hypothetical protein NDAI_0I02510 [Naumovozyma dairenensis CBS 421]CCD26819.1 hypothetical protein NDAI_0I02510 [Naumovozyma dairenensis CBS 421]